ncbi:hypothetical protein GCM10009557_06080 [Virgisporangium ochraceum]|uniref:Uncharacterized protein n=1 Tax=Virgisporangium ochraceum TaxID=65505 RepID=A0A8J4E8K6_9ACTN|nr:hypothetical protein [Virgisporangium ochraceum]GIJ66265.1 hypothetical protein Voc01_011820 [Virgisporangium ochraceum]
MPDTFDAEAIARAFHEAYERLAPSFGYETRKASAVPWADVPEPNRQLMTAVAAEIAPLVAAKPIRERDSLARRLGIRYGELEEARTALRQAHDELDQLSRRPSTADQRKAEAALIDAWPNLADDPVHVEQLAAIALNAAYNPAWRPSGPGSVAATRTTDARTCVGCGDDVWPGERVWPTGHAGVLCAICQAKAEPTRTKPGIGEATSGGDRCAYSGPNPGPATCNDEATIHLLITDAQHPAGVALAACTQHARIARASGQLVDEHIFQPGCAAAVVVWGWDHCSPDTTVPTPEPDEPCQPIGCDNGYHLPGCQYAEADTETVDRSVAIAAGPAPTESHDDECEAEWVEGARSWTTCRCAQRNCPHCDGDQACTHCGSGV